MFSAHCDINICWASTAMVQPISTKNHTHLAAIENINYVIGLHVAWSHTNVVCGRVKKASSLEFLNNDGKQLKVIAGQFMLQDERCSPIKEPWLQRQPPGL